MNFKVEYRGASLHYRDEPTNGIRRYAWFPLDGGRAWRGSKDEAKALILKHGQMMMGAQVVECQQ